MLEQLCLSDRSKKFGREFLAITADSRNLISSILFKISLLHFCNNVRSNKINEKISPCS
jgi:hypothetical protein